MPMDFSNEQKSPQKNWSLAITTAAQRAGLAPISIPTLEVEGTTGPVSGHAHPWLVGDLLSPQSGFLYRYSHRSDPPSWTTSPPVRGQSWRWERQLPFPLAKRLSSALRAPADQLRFPLLGNHYRPRPDGVVLSPTFTASYVALFSTVISSPGITRRIPKRDGNARLIR